MGPRCRLGAHAPLEHLDNSQVSIKCKEGATVVGTFSSAALFEASPFARKWGLDYSMLGHYGHLLVLNISQKSELFIGYLDGDAEELGVALDKKLAKHASLRAEPGSEHSLAIDRKVLTGISMAYLAKHFNMSHEELKRRLRDNDWTEAQREIIHMFSAAGGHCKASPKHDLRERVGLIVGLVAAVHHYLNHTLDRTALDSKSSCTTAQNSQDAFTSEWNRRDSTVSTHETSRRSRELSPCPKMSRNGTIWPRESTVDVSGDIQSLLNFHTGGPTISTPTLRGSGRV